MAARKRAVVLAFFNGFSKGFLFFAMAGMLLYGSHLLKVGALGGAVDIDLVNGPCMSVQDLLQPAVKFLVVREMAESWPRGAQDMAEV